MCHIVGTVMAPRSTYGDHKGTRQTFDVRRKLYRLTLEPDAPIFINVMGLTLKSDIKYVYNTYIY